MLIGFVIVVSIAYMYFKVDKEIQKKKNALINFINIL